MQAVEQRAMSPLKESHRIYGGKHQEFYNLEKISLGTKALVFLWNAAQYMQYLLFVLAVFVETVHIEMCDLHCSLLGVFLAKMVSLFCKMSSGPSLNPLYTYLGKDNPLS